MDNFFKCDFEISEITLAMLVKSGTGTRYHRNRTSHGIAFNVCGNKKYIFNRNKTIDLNDNQIIYLPKGSNYEIKNHSSGDCYAINFNFHNDVNLDSFCIDTNNNITYQVLFKQAADIWLRKSCGYVLKCKSILYELLYLMKKDYNDLNCNKYYELVRPAIEYININYSRENISINKLANLCNISDTYFRRIFYDIYGTTPIKYINKLKIMRAEELLFSGMYSVREVCSLSGFTNECYFSRIFRKNTGIAPSEYGK